MMSSYRQRRDKHPRRLFFATVAVIFVLAIDLASGGVLRAPVRMAGVALGGAIAQLLGPLAESGFFSSRRALKVELDLARQELSRLRFAEVEARMLREELEELQSLVNLNERESGITAPIISSVESSLYSTFVIGAGEEDGIALGDLVLAGGGGGILVGRVREVSRGQSLVSEILSPGARTRAIINGAPFELEGRGGGNARVSIPAEFELALGDLAYVREGSSYAVAGVGAIVDEPSSVYKEVYLRAPVAISALRFVYVVSP